MPNVWFYFRQYIINRFWADSTKEDETTPIMDKDDYLRMAVIHGDEFQVISLLKMGANVGRKNNMGYNILHIAVKEGRFGLIEKLVKYGNGIEKEGASEYRPLIQSILYSNKKEECFDALLKAKISLNTLDFFGNSLLHNLAQLTPNKVDLIEKVMDLGLDPRDVNAKGNNCLHLLALSRLSNKREALHLAAKFLHQRGVDINAENLAGQTALQRAGTARGDTSRIVDFLLREGAGIHSVNKYGAAVYETLLSAFEPVTKVFLKHLALRKFRGDLEIEDRLKRIIESDDFSRKTYREFEKELTRLQRQRIHIAYEVTYLDILCHSKRAVVKYLKYPGIKERTHIIHFKSYCFHSEIKRKLDEAKEMLKAEELAFMIVNSTFENELSYLSVKKVTKFLTPRILEVWKNYSYR